MSDNINNLPPLRDVIDQNGLRAKKSLGQNFLLDLNLTRKIARAARLPEKAEVIEVGPGPGGLSRAILMEYPDARLSAIEMDSRAIGALSPLVDAADGRLTLIEGDAMAYDAYQGHIVANLPYNIATPLLVGWLRQIHAGDALHSITIMVQKEVAQRITAATGAKHYGRLAVLTQCLCHARIALTLPPSAFTPPPKVDSAVVHLRPKKTQDLPPFEAIEAITAQAFQQRRKMLRASLKPYLPAMGDLGIDPQARPETLSVEQFIALAKSRNPKQ